MKGTLKGAAFGALIASAAALLLAPSSGKKLRTDMKKFMDSTSADMKKQMKKMKGMSQSEYEHFFLKTLADAAQKKEDAAVIISDVREILKNGWNDIKQELKKKPLPKTPAKKTKK